MIDKNSLFAVYCKWICQLMKCTVMWINLFRLLMASDVQSHRFVKILEGNYRHHAVQTQDAKMQDASRNIFSPAHQSWNIIKKPKWEKWIVIPTLYNDIRCSVYGINIVRGKTGILSSISLGHVLDVKSSRRGDVDASVVGKWRPIAFCPGDARLRLACGAALQGHALSHQHLSVLGLDHETWPCWRSEGRGEGRTWEWG